MQTFFVNLLMSAVFKKVAIKVIIAVLEKLAKDSDNTLDDEIVKAVKEAL